MLLNMTVPPVVRMDTVPFPSMVSTGGSLEMAAVEPARVTVLAKLSPEVNDALLDAEKSIARHFPNWLQRAGLRVEHQ